MLILVCNVGSTSLKYKLFNMPDETILVEAKTERVGRTDAIFTYRNHCSGYSEKLENLDIPNYAAGIRLFLRYLLGEESGYCREITELEAIGFKTVLAKGYYGVHELTGEVLNVIRGLKSSDSTMIVVTHEISFARDVADKVIFMADGVIEEEGTPRQVIENPQSPRTQAFLSRFNQYSD